MSFGGKPAFEVMEMLSHYVSSDHRKRKRTLAEFLLIMPETYTVFGLSKDGEVQLILEDLLGDCIEGKLKHADSKSFAKVFYEEPDSFGIYVPDGWKTVYAVYDVQAPISRKHLRQHYWATSMSMPGSKNAVYIQINKNDNADEGETQFDFILRTFQEIRQQDPRPDRIIIDLRYNLGGWIKNTAALSRLLYGSDYYKPGKVVVLIGRESVSAGTILAADIENSNYAYFIGEPSGSKPNMFLDHKQMELPYSKFYAENSTDSFLTTTENDKRRYVAPDLLINESFTQFISGKDVALEKALEVEDEIIKNAQGGYYRGDLWKRPSQACAMKK